jgi:ATP-dependent helicase HrpA
VEPAGVAVRVLSTAAEQAAAMRAGTRALLLNTVAAPTKTALALLSTTDRLALSQSPYRSVDALVDDCRACAVDELVAAFGGPVRSPAAFETLTARVRPELLGAVRAIVALVAPVLAEVAAVRAAVADCAAVDIADDVRHQLDTLVFDGFVAELGSARLRELPRYLRGARLRLESLPASADRDRLAMATLDEVCAAYGGLRAALPAARREAAEVGEIFWMIEELRVSLFAQRLGTPYPVSAKRIHRAIAAVR